MYFSMWRTGKCIQIIEGMKTFSSFLFLHMSLVDCVCFSDFFLVYSFSFQGCLILFSCPLLFISLSSRSDQFCMITYSIFGLLQLSVCPAIPLNALNTHDLYCLCSKSTMCSCPVSNSILIILGLIILVHSGLFSHLYNFFLVMSSCSFNL